MPETVTENVAVWPVLTVSLAGWVVIEGDSDTPEPVIAIVAFWMVTNGATETLEPFTRTEVD